MPKLQWMKFYPADWINDTRELSPEAKAAWIDMICLMWNAPHRGQWTGTYQEFARATGLPWEMAPQVVTELGHKTSRVTIRDSKVTLENRRMTKQESHYKDHSKRQQAYRERRASDKKVTDKTPQESLRVLKTTPCEPAVRELIDQVFLCLTAKLGEKPKSFPAGRFGSFIKRALKDIPVPDFKSRIEYWFQSTDEFVVRNGWAINLFMDKFSLLKGGPLYAQENRAVRGGVSPQASAGKYATITENGDNAEIH